MLGGVATWAPVPHPATRKARATAAVTLRMAPMTCSYVPSAATILLSAKGGTLATRVGGMVMHSGILPGAGWTGREWERQTTLLAAICLPDSHILCISDRRNLVVDGGSAARIVDGDKWRRVGSAPHLLWGWAGGNQVGLGLALHVEAATASWDTLKAVVRRELPTLCGHFPKEPADCLIAGWIEDTPGILQIRSDGTFSGRAGDPARLEPQFVGWSSLSAELAWTYATQRLSAPPTSKNFRIYLAHSARVERSQ
jgi:hypothetical protein